MYPQIANITEEQWYGMENEEFNRVEALIKTLSLSISIALAAGAIVTAIELTTLLPTWIVRETLEVLQTRIEQVLQEKHSREE